MTLFWRLGSGMVLAFAAVPAAAQTGFYADKTQYFDRSVRAEFTRVSPTVQRYCLERTGPKFDHLQSAVTTDRWHHDFADKLLKMPDSDLRAEEASLTQRIEIARERGGGNPNDRRPNALGDLEYRLDLVVAQREGRARGEAGYYLAQRAKETPLLRFTRQAIDDRTRAYNDTILNCLEFKDRFPQREWHDPDPLMTGQNIAGLQKSDETPIAPSEDAENARWAGTYSDGGNVYVVSGSGAGMTASGKSNDGRATGFWSGCDVTGSTARCSFSGTYRDADKTASYTGLATLTLENGAISGTHRLSNVQITWTVPEYGTAFRNGASFPFRLTRQK